MDEPAHIRYAKKHLPQHILQTVLRAPDPDEQELIRRLRAPK